MQAAGIPRPVLQPLSASLPICLDSCIPVYLSCAFPASLSSGLSSGSRFFLCFSRAVLTLQMDAFRACWKRQGNDQRTDSKDN